jgi:hypothetical protein
VSGIRGGVPAHILTMSTAQVVEVVEERDRLIDWSNTIANRMGDNFDGDESQEYIVDRWLDLVEERLRAADPAWHRYLFKTGPNPENDGQQATR